MELKNLKRNPSAVASSINIGAVMTATADVEIWVPKRYEDIDLYKAGISITLCGVFLIKVGNNYAVSVIPGSFELTPLSIIVDELDGVPYNKLTFPKGSTMASSAMVLGDSENMFALFSEFIINGKIPSFLTETDLFKLFINGGKYVDKKLGSSIKVIEFLVSIVSRNKLNPNKFIRQTPGEVRFVGLNDMKYSYSDIAKITHNYLRRGLTVSMTSPAEEATDLDEILRK